jgi:hypothetical protein
MKFERRLGSEKIDSIHTSSQFFGKLLACLTPHSETD